MRFAASQLISFLDPPAGPGTMVGSDLGHESLDAGLADPRVVLIVACWLSDSRRGKAYKLLFCLLAADRAVYQLLANNGGNVVKLPSCTLMQAWAWLDWSPMQGPEEKYEVHGWGG